MDWEKILTTAGYNDDDAKRIASELRRLGVTRANLDNLPRFVGTKLMGFPTYKVVYDITRNAEYAERIAQALTPPVIESGVTVLEQFYKRISGIVDVSMIAELREMGATPETVSHITEEAFEKIGVQKAKVAKIRKLAQDFIGS